MKTRTHIGFWLLVCAVAMLLAPLFIPPDMARSRLDTEVGAIQDVLGARIGNVVVGTANSVHDALARNGVTQLVQAGVHSSEELREAGRYFSGIGLFFATLGSNYAAGLGIQLYGVTLRFLIIVAWMLVLAPLFAASVVDGLCVRDLRRSLYRSEAPTSFAIGWHLVIVLSALPLLYVALPIFVTPLFMPLWALVVMVPLRLAVSHTQPMMGT